MQGRLHRGVWLGLLVLLLSACVGRPGELEPRHQPSGRTAPLPAADFAAYIDTSKKHIAAANRAIGRPLQPEVIEDRAPFEMEPGSRCSRPKDGRYERAALLIHGVSHTPYLMRDVGRRFADACYLVRAILLPGHGTVPGDLLTVDYGAWQEAVSEAVQSFEGKAERLYLIGFSTGGTLAIDYALHAEPPGFLELAGLVLLAPAIELGSEINLLDDVNQAYVGFLGGVNQTFGQYDPRSRWLTVVPDEDPVKYESVAKNAGYQVQSLALELDGPSAVLNLPVFMAISADDAVVGPYVARNWFCNQLAGPRQLIWYTKTPQVIAACPAIVERQSHPSEAILDMSHVGLPVAPNNPRYGVDGSYLSCSHYYWESDEPSWFRCTDRSQSPADSDIRYGEITEANLNTHIVRRLTYNPDFYDLSDEILAFFDDPQ